MAKIFELRINGKLVTDFEGLENLLIDHLVNFLQNAKTDETFEIRCEL